MTMKAITLLLPVSLLHSAFLPAATTEQLIIQANQQDSTAQLSLGLEYQQQSNLQQAHYWLVKAAINGNSEALSALGALFEQDDNQPLPSLTQAENWYQLAEDAGIPEAGDAYARVLEKQFNLRQARQVSAINLLDQAADASIAINQSNPPEVPGNSSGKIYTEVIVITGVVLLILASLLIRKKRRKNQHNKQVNLSDALTNKDKQIRTLQSSLNKAFDQLKRQQYLQQKQAKEHSFTLACTLFGFNPRKLPDDKTIKIRYKKLCRVYHPDAHGSDEEMKRLNGAFKVIMNHLEN